MTFNSLNCYFLSLIHVLNHRPVIEELINIKGENGHILGLVDRSGLLSIRMNSIKPFQRFWNSNLQDLEHDLLAQLMTLNRDLGLKLIQISQSRQNIIEKTFDFVINSQPSIIKMCLKHSSDDIINIISPSLMPDIEHSLTLKSMKEINQETKDEGLIHRLASKRFRHQSGQQLISSEPLTSQTQSKGPNEDLKLTVIIGKG